MSRAVPLPPSVSEAERIPALDAMRGVAIAGVLVAYTVWNLGSPPVATWSAADRVIERTLDLLVDGKFLTMFAVLFGAGVAQQWRRWEAAGREPLALHLRRMGFLLAAGLLHATLLRNGDILAPYALMGLVLPLFRRASGRALAAWAVALVALPALVRWGAAAAGFAWPPRPGAVPGGYLAENLAWLRYWYVTNPLLSWPRVLALMLAGLALGRGGALERLARDGRASRRGLVAFGLAAIAVRAGLELLAARWNPGGVGRGIVIRFLFELSAWMLAGAYGCGILALMRSPAAVRALAPVRALGRMAFTNYLLQALIVVPYALATSLFDRVAPARGLLLALVILAAQLVFSTAWIARFGIGPLERLWRAFTYRTPAVSPRIAAAPDAG